MLKGTFFFLHEIISLVGDTVLKFVQGPVTQDHVSRAGETSKSYLYSSCSQKWLENRFCP